MKVYAGWVDLLLMLAFAASVLGVFVQRYALYRDLRGVIPGLSQYLATTLFYLEINYLRNRRRMGSRRLDMRVALAFLFPVAVWWFAVVLFQRFAE